MAGHIPQSGAAAGGPERVTVYAWLVFALSFGLLISDYMARQVLNAVFPLLKAEWSLSDAKLGLLSGIVAIMVGVLTFPLSLAADRWGRVRSLTLMAILWSIATLLCAVAESFETMLIGRALVGIGEAAYGSVGIAVVISVFPPRLRATLSAAFMAGGSFGQILGVAIGGTVAANYGWRPAFAMIGFGGLLLGVLYPIIVRERRIRTLGGVPLVDPAALGIPLRTLIGNRSVRLAYLGSGLQLFAAGALPAWLPSYFNRAYGLPVDQAGLKSDLGIIDTRMSLRAMNDNQLGAYLRDRRAKLLVPAACLIVTAALLVPAFGMMSPGSLQFAFLCAGGFMMTAASGSVPSVAIDVIHPGLRATAAAMVAVVQNLFGLALGPLIAGALSDAYGLGTALAITPLFCVASAFVLMAGARAYAGDLASAETLGVSITAN